MSLNTDQQQASDTICNLFSGPDPKAAILTGAAGTGKTWLTDDLAESLNPVLCAMTHKAASVMAKATDKEVHTLAKVLKQKKYDNKDTGETQFVSAEIIKLPEGRKTLFIDESSMMNKANFNQVANGLMPNYNVLFIGDKYQLPPVNEDQSLSLIQDIPHAELMKPMRFNENSGIDKTAISIRTALEHGHRKMAGMKEILAQYDDVMWVSATEAAEMMIARFKAAEDVDDVRMISFTNKRVEAFNYHLKQAVTGDVDRFKAGDILMANAAFSRPFEVRDENGVPTGRWEDKVVIQNNETVLVKHIIETSAEGIDCYQIDLDNGEQVYVPIDRHMFEYKIAQLKDRALSFPSGTQGRRQNFGEMFRLKNGFADLRLSYAQTVHKSQGSSYKTTFFDLQALNSETQMGKKLLYTGVTRASEQLVLFK